MSLYGDSKTHVAIAKMVIEKEREKERNSPSQLFSTRAMLGSPDAQFLAFAYQLIRAYHRIDLAWQESMASSSPASPNSNNNTPSMFQNPQINGLVTSSAGTGFPTLAIDDRFWEHPRAKAGRFKSTGQLNMRRQ
ncbi:hypothetical protein FRC01_011922 [Tulasnella sp. 417]|nr:hypothetical protein FRC01_011922 [Tulasnella sp. 417]